MASHESGVKGNMVVNLRVSVSRSSVLYQKIQVCVSFHEEFQGLLLMNNQPSDRGGAQVKKATWQSALQASKGNNVLHVGVLLLKFGIKKRGIVPMFVTRIWVHESKGWCHLKA